jgi:hypothetical protein
VPRPHCPRAAPEKRGACLLESGARANENALKLALDATQRSIVVCSSAAPSTPHRHAAADRWQEGLPRRLPGAARPLGDPAAAPRSRHGRGRDLERSSRSPESSIRRLVPRAAEQLRCRPALIFDEVKTKRRLGSFWAAQRRRRPDLFTTAKARPAASIGL